MPQTWPLVGRSGELRLLKGLLAKSGTRGMIVGGPAGVGKTRLVHEGVRQAAGADVEAVHLTATRASAVLPFGAIAPLLPPQSWAAASGGGVDTVGMLRQVSRALEQRTAGRRLVLVVDDAHHLDDGSAVLIHQLVAEGTATLLATLRSGVRAPEPVVALWKDGLVDRLDLDGLDGEALGDLLAQALAGPVDPAAVVRLAAWSRGNALYLKELVTGSLTTGALAQVGGLWRLVGELSPSRRLVELVESRLDRLAGAEREILEVVALGAPMRVEELAAVTDIDFAESLEARGFLTSSVEDGRVRFRLAHPVHVEVLRQQMPNLRRQRISAALASAVEALGNDLPEDQLRLATWRMYAGDARADLLMNAAGTAKAHHELAMAEEFAHAALRQGAGFPAELLIATLASARGRGDEAEQRLVSLLERGVDEGQRTAVLVARIDNLRLLGRFREALSLLEGPTEDDVAASMEVMSRKAGLLLDTRGPGAAADLVEWVCARGAGLPLAWACVVGATALTRQGRSDAAIELARRGEIVGDMPKDTRDPWPAALAALARADALATAGRLAEAHEVARSEHEAAVLSGSVDAQAFAALELANVYLGQGRLRSAIQHAREAAALFRVLSRMPVLGDCLITLATAEAMRADAQAAAAALAEHDRLDREPSYWRGVDLLVARGWAAAARGEVAAARGFFEDAYARGSEIGDLVGSLGALHNIARIGFAKEAAARLEQTAPAVEGGLAAARVLHVTALAAKEIDNLLAVSEAFEQMGANLLAAEAAADAAVVLAAAGEPRKAGACQRRAGDLSERCEGALTPALRSVETRQRLTPAERQVALLAAAGRPNRDIAKTLVLSLRTVENRLHRIYEKLGISGRAELASALRNEAGDMT